MEHTEHYLVSNNWISSFAYTLFSLYKTHGIFAEFRLVKYGFDPTFEITLKKGNQKIRRLISFDEFKYISGGVDNANACISSLIEDMAKQLVEMEAKKNGDKN